MKYNRQDEFIEKALRKILAGESTFEVKDFDLARHEGIGRVYFSASKESPADSKDAETGSEVEVV